MTEHCAGLALLMLLLTDRRLYEHSIAEQVNMQLLVKVRMCGKVWRSKTMS